MDLKTPKLSVVVPVYNAERYLPDCLKSILAQRFSDYEVICIDDGSEDETLKILTEFQRNWHNLQVFAQPHGGPGAARNFGLSKAKGEYIYFLDSDDMLSSGSLSFMTETMERGKLDILAFSAEVLFENERLERERYRDVQGFSYRKAYGRYDKGSRLFHELIRFGDFIPNACLMCFRHEFLKRNNIHFPSLLRCEDEVFCIRTWLAAATSEHTDRKLYRKRVRDGSLMVTAASFEYFRDAAEAWRDIMGLLGTTGDESIKSAIRSHLSRRAQEMRKRFEALPKEEQAKLHHLPRLEAEYDAFLLEMAPVFHQVSASYLFPWHLFRRGERVAIYGAGNVGRDFVRQLQEFDYVKLAGVVDRDGPRAKIPGTEVDYPQSLRDMDYDALLLSVQDKSLVDSIKGDLKKLGIDEYKVRWDGEHYLRQDFFSGIYFPWLDRCKLCGEKQK